MTHETRTKIFEFLKSEPVMKAISGITSGGLFIRFQRREPTASQTDIDQIIEDLSPLNAQIRATKCCGIKLLNIYFGNVDLIEDDRPDFVCNL